MHYEWVGRIIHHCGLLSFAVDIDNQDLRVIYKELHSGLPFIQQTMNPSHGPGAVPGIGDTTGNKTGTNPRFPGGTLSLGGNRTINQMYKENV